MAIDENVPTLSKRWEEYGTSIEHTKGGMGAWSLDISFGTFMGYL